MFSYKLLIKMGMVSYLMKKLKIYVKLLQKGKEYYILFVRVVVAGDGNFLDKLSDFYTKIVFDSVMVDYEKEIPLELIKHEILQKNENSNLLLMFCGADI